MKDGGTGEGEEERKEKGDVGRGLRLLFDIEPDKYATSFTICLTFSIDNPVSWATCAHSRPSRPSLGRSPAVAPRPASLPVAAVTHAAFPAGPWPAHSFTFLPSQHVCSSSLPRASSAHSQLTSALIVFQLTPLPQANRQPRSLFPSISYRATLFTPFRFPPSLIRRASRPRAPFLWACTTRTFSPAHQPASAHQHSSSIHCRGYPRTYASHTDFLPGTLPFPHLLPVTAQSALSTRPLLEAQPLMSDAHPAHHHTSRTLATRYRTAPSQLRSNSIRSLGLFPYVLRPRSICRPSPVPPNAAAPAVLHSILAIHRYRTLSHRISRLPPSLLSSPTNPGPYGL